MRLRILGTSSGMASMARHFSGYLIESESKTILMEAGDGIVRQLVRCHIHPLHIDSVIISHTHPDHAAGLPAVIQWMHLHKRTEPFSLYLPEGTENQIQNIFAFFHLYPDKLSFDIKYYPVSQGIFYEKNSVRIYGIQNTHLSKNKMYAEPFHIHPACFGFFIEDSGKRLLYTADTETLEPFKYTGRLADLFLSESTHLSIEEICRFVLEHQIPKTICTHIPDEKEHRIRMFIKKFDHECSIRLASEGENIEV